MTLSAYIVATASYSPLMFDKALKYKSVSLTTSTDDTNEPGDNLDNVAMDLNKAMVRMIRKLNKGTTTTTVEMDSIEEHAPK